MIALVQVDEAIDVMNCMTIAFALAKCDVADNPLLYET